MQSFREQSSYGSQQTYPPEAHGTSRLEDFSSRQQAQIFQSNFGGRRGGTSAPAAVPPGETSSIHSYQAYRKESSDFYFLGNKEGGTSGTNQTPQRRPSGPVQSYGPPQGNSSSGTNFGTHYGREGHHSQFAGQHSATGNMSQYSQDFPGSFSPGGSQYASHVTSQQLRHQLYQSQPLSQSGNPPTPAGTSHLQQMQRSAALNSPAGYQLRMGQFGQHYQSHTGSSSGTFPPSQRFGQSGSNYEGYSPGGANSPYESHMPGTPYGTQQGYSSYTSQHMKSFETSKLPQSGNQGQSQQQQSPHVMQYSNSKMPLQNQTGQYSQSDVPVRSPMQFQQNFSPISNPSPAASVVQSPSCSSTPSPLMTSGENLQCAQSSVPVPSRNRILQIMPQLSPTPHSGGFKGFGVEGSTEKRLTDPGLSSLSALSTQVANLPNTVQHMLLSDALAPKKSVKRTSRKGDSCANSETSSQAEEQLKSPMAESLDGSCSSSSGDPGERVRQLSGQSTSSEAGYKGSSYEKPVSPSQRWPPDLPEKARVQEVEPVPEAKETFQEVSKVSEKSVGVIVAMETVANRSEKVTEETSVISNEDTEATTQPEVPEVADNDNSRECNPNQNGEPCSTDPVPNISNSGHLTEADTSPVGSALGFKEELTFSRNSSSFPLHPKTPDASSFGVQGDKKTGVGRSDKYPSLLQEVLQGHHQQERRYARSTQDPPPVSGSNEGTLRPNILMSQASELTNRSILSKTLAPHLETPQWGPWDRKSGPDAKPLNVADHPITRKFEVESPTTCQESSGVPSERRSVICDISPLRQLVRDPSSSHQIVSGQERSADSRSGQSVILPSGMMCVEAKSNIQVGMPKEQDLETPKIHRKRTAEHCMPYSAKESSRGNASPRSVTYDPVQDYSVHNSRGTHGRRGAGRMGTRGRLPVQSQDISDKLKMSPGRSRGSTETHHINPAMSLSERASREAFYSAFFQNTDNSALGYHTNSRSSSYGDSHAAFTSPLHYKRPVYQQEEYKEWLGSPAQSIFSASHHRQELQRKSPRQEQFHIRSPGRSENEPGYSQPATYHDTASVDYGRQLRVGDGGPTSLTTLEMKRNAQKTPPGDSANWNLGHQTSPVKKIGSPIGSSQKSFSTDVLAPRAAEATEMPKPGFNAHRPQGPDEQSHHNPLIMRRRVRSFISPIPSKRQSTDDKGRPTSALKESSDRNPVSQAPSPRVKDSDFTIVSDEPSKSGPEQSPSTVSLSSPVKTKILPPRKGRGLKLEAIVQKITSPNVRRIPAPSNAESATEAVTLDEILSLKIKGPETGNGSMQESEMPGGSVPEISCTEGTTVISLSPKSIDDWIQEEKKVKTEVEEQSMETKDFSQSGFPVQASNHYMELKGAPLPVESKCALPQVQQCDIVEKEKLPGMLCNITPKQEIIPPKGYFPSGKKKGRPIGSVNKQKKQQQHLLQEVQQLPPEEKPAILPVSVQPQNLGEQSTLVEPKPKRRRTERRKPAGTQRRRRGRQAAPIVAPIEPEIKLKYASQTLDKTETKTKSFFPYIHVENKEELGLSCVIINAEEEELRWKKLTSVRKGQRSASPQPSTDTKALPSSSFMVQGPTVTESTTMGHLVCCLCGKWANFRNLGDLFGPFYTQEYATTLSKNPPPKKLSETPRKVKVRHKDASDGSKTDSDEEEEEEPQQAREQRSLTAHPRYKRRNRSGDCTSRLPVPSRRKTTDSSELPPVDSSGPSTAEGGPEQGIQIPELPLDSNEFWMHEGCVLWANGIYFVCGRLYGLQEAVDIAREMKCTHCLDAGATLGCYNKGCTCCYHLPCAMDSECLLSEENFSVRCPKHKVKLLK
ncbi:hypothetical protein GDO86_007516 [Hymenochirus boettgeri]|uniref:PHD-type domain-containing protein n=1 Tax=Hymenochirus boettgeri TaxID=247094 RepID=A0A8T2J191_9PIPI|nr:hypothetical protein GDO86_007516 [Hymenochirus boettgeri]KAG8436451.1 hypothetical protein GDO86_007516 [Hymenochirus boettgeri]